jgi:hypothetical protein
MKQDEIVAVAKSREKCNKEEDKKQYLYGES